MGFTDGVSVESEQGEMKRNYSALGEEEEKRGMVEESPRMEKNRREAVDVRETEFRAELLHTIPVWFPWGRKYAKNDKCPYQARGQLVLPKGEEKKKKKKKKNGEVVSEAMGDGGGEGEGNGTDNGHRRSKGERKRNSSDSAAGGGGGGGKGVAEDDSAFYCLSRSEAPLDRIWSWWRGPQPLPAFRKLCRGLGKWRNRAADAMCSDRYVYFFPWAQRVRSNDWCEEESIRRRKLENGRQQFLRKCRIAARDRNSSVFYSASTFNRPAGRLAEATPSLPLDVAIGDRMITIVTTACLPWLTGTSINPLLRAAYLESEHRARVTLLVPYLEPDDQRQVYPDLLTFDRPVEQEAYIRHWVHERLNLMPRFRILFYPAYFDSQKNSIFPMPGFDVTELISDSEADVAVLEEPEHLCWYHFGQRWRNKFRLVIGVAHTNYVEYVKREPAGTCLAFLLWLVNIQVARANCDRVIRLSAGVQHFARSIVSNVHGVAPQFLKQSGLGDSATKSHKSSVWNGRYRTPMGSSESIMSSESAMDDDFNDRGLAVPWTRTRSMEPGVQMHFIKGCYFIGKMIWGKGYTELCDLLIHHCKKYPVKFNPCRSLRQSLDDGYLRSGRISLRQSFEDGSLRGSTASLRHFADEYARLKGSNSLRCSIDEGFMVGSSPLRRSFEGDASLRTSFSSSLDLGSKDFDTDLPDRFPKPDTDQRYRPSMVMNLERRLEIEAQRKHLIKSFLRRIERPDFGRDDAVEEDPQEGHEEEDEQEEEEERVEDGEEESSQMRVAGNPGSSGPVPNRYNSQSKGHNDTLERVDKDGVPNVEAGIPRYRLENDADFATAGHHGSETASTEDEEPELQVDIFGSGSEEREIEEFAMKHNLPMVFHGRRDHADLSIRAYKVFINPSISDVLCTTTAEALAMGKFVVVADHPSNEFFMRNFPENCLSYDPNDPDHFSQTVLYALKNQPTPLTAKQRQMLTWEAATERFLEAAGL